MVIERFEVYLVNLDRTQGREIQKNPTLSRYFSDMK